MTVNFEQFAKASLVGVFLSFPMFLGLANTFMALALLFWLLAGHFAERWQAVRGHPLTWPAIGMFALVVLGVFYTVAPLDQAMRHVGKYSKFLFIPLALSLLTEGVWRSRCLYAFWMAMLFTLASTYAGIWWSVPWSVSRGNLGWGVDHTVFKDHIAQGLLMSTFVLLALAQGFKTQSKLNKCGWLVVALLAAMSILFLSHGRSGYLALLVGLGVFGWVWFAHPLRKFLAILLLIMAAVLSYFSSPVLQGRVNQGYAEVVSALARPVNQSDEAITSLGIRIDMWRVSVQSIIERPILGSGTGSYPVLAQQAFHSPALLSTAGVHPHNQFLFFGVELGLVGLLGYVFYLYRAGTAGRHMSLPDKAALCGFIAIMVSDSLFHGALWLAVENHLFTFMLALLAAMPEAKQEPSTQTG